MAFTAFEFERVIGRTIKTLLNKNPIMFTAARAGAVIFFYRSARYPFDD